MKKSLDLLGKDKFSKAIEFIQEYEPEEGYFLGFSGGKDSVVLYDLAEKAKVKFTSYYSSTSIDPPEVMKFIRDNYPGVKWLKPNYKGKRSFFGMIPLIGFPTRFVRWCCNELKKYPSKNIPLKHRLLGIRAEESISRAKRHDLVEFIKYQKLEFYVYKPLFHWLEWEIWEYIEEYNLPYCSLYDEGFDRLGCVICPFICGPNSKQLSRNKEKWPKHYKAFEKAMYKLWINREKDRQLRLGYSKTFGEFLDNWYNHRFRKVEEEDIYYDKRNFFDSRK